MGKSQRAKTARQLEIRRVPRDPTRWSDAGRRSYSAVHGYYEDKPIKCLRCDASFTFLAATQQHWFEELKLHPCVRPTLCPACAALGRTERALEQALHAALRAARAAPHQVEAQLALVRARVLHFEGSRLSHTQTPTSPRWRHLSWRNGAKNLRAAIAECARIRELDPSDRESLAWQARAERALANLGPETSGPPE